MTSALIVGGGPIGAALALAWDGAATLFAPPVGGGGRYYAMNAASINFLTAAAGDSPPVRARVRRFLLCAGGRRRFLSAPAELPLCRIVGEEALLHWLHSALRRKGAEIYSAAPSALHSDGGGANVRLPDGREFSAPLLVAADGARSAAARMLNVGAAVCHFGQRALTARLFAPMLADDIAAQWFARRDVLAFLPIGGGEFAMVWSLPKSVARETAAGGAASVVAAACARTGFAVSAADDSAPGSFALFASRRAVRVAAKTAFVGDAARAVHPLAGQGLNAGLSDCALLLRCLRKCGNADAALVEYAARGGRRGAALHGITSFLNRFGGLADPLFAAASCPPFNRLAARAANFGE